MWWGPSRSGFSCASGTALNPIVFNSYGTGAKPNMLYPYPTATAARDKLVLGFSGVEYITVDGLQFNDTRFSVTDKVGTTLTKTGIMLGEGTSGIGYCNNCIVKNCDFSNIGSAIEAAGNYQIIDSNTITNLKSWGDTSGANDGGAMPIARSNGKHCRITHNYIKGGWCFTGATASGQGLNGVGIEILNDFDSSFIGYNTIIDCAGGFELGSQIGSGSGPDNDTFAYNKFINLGSLAYAATNTGGAFGGTIRKLRFWNNVYVQNQWSRLAGPRFGADTYSDGQSFAQFPSWGNGSGIPPGSYPYNSSRILGNYNIWSVLAYNYDTGVSTDTVYDSRNNVFWMTAGLPILKTNASTINLKRRNNIYHVAGSDSYPSILGPSGTTLSTGELSTTAKVFNDSTSNFPENWNMQLFSGSPAVDAGTVTGVSPDFAGVPVVGVPEIGIYQFAPATGRKFYFSSTTGNDSYTITQAQNPATPWQTLKKVQDLSRSLTFTAGDTLAFKCGDVFANGYDVSFGSMKWWNKPYAGYAAPSGTAGNPIVFMSYGTGAKPNFLFPLPETCCTTTPDSKTKHAMSFEGVSYLEFRDLQFNDTRFSYTDKVSTAYTIAGLQIGEFGTLTDPFRASADHIMVDNCYFANIGYGVACAGHYQTIQNCTFENFKSAGDTSGMTDIGSDAFYSEGWYNGLLKNNIFRGSWSYTNASGTGGGKVGGHIEVLNQFDDNLIIYNTFIDADGHMEFGSNLGSTFGANRDTFAYNKFINGSIIAYYHIGDAFGGTSSNQHYWNNVFVENDWSRMTGVRFGTDVYSDGQSFAQFPGWPALPQNPVPVGYSSWRPIMYTTDAGIVADTLIDVRNNVFWCTKA
jgi:hypothetical protein